MSTAKKGVWLLAETCRRKGIRKVVFSPGSRSAPLVIAFSEMPEIECMVIPDERVAGYFALGMAQQLCEPVAVVCTSGTAALNLLPAACEAFYQQVPILFITADRPDGALRKGENQAIYQEQIFAQFAYDRNIDADKDSMVEIISTVEEVMFRVTDWQIPGRLNVHMDEPLYETANYDSGPIPQDLYRPEAFENTTKLRIDSHDTLLNELNGVSRKMLIIGTKNKDKAFIQKIKQLAERADVVVLTETTSNTPVKNAVFNYDSSIELISENSLKDLIPDVVLTFGNQIISKRIRQLLRKHKPKNHWNIPVTGEMKLTDYFEINGDQRVYLRESEALDCLLESTEQNTSSFKEQWQQLHQNTEKLNGEYLAGAPFSDLKVFQTLIHSLPPDANIQYGNSTPVRYSNFFSPDPTHSINSNRGTSGIDGCLSTAAGAAYANKKMTIAVVGDISFFYDSNALWNNYLSSDLRIIMINNSGGNIFRLLNGPTGVKDFEKFFETKHNLSAEHLAAMYGIPYYFCDRQIDLDNTLKTFYEPQNGKTAILEIKTDGVLSAEVYKGYYEFLKSNK